MIDEISRLLAVNGYLPHGYCINWSPTLLWTFVISDILIFVSYFSMPDTRHHKQPAGCRRSLGSPSFNLPD